MTTATCSSAITIPVASPDAAYDITGTGNCSLSLSGGGAGKLETVTLILRQDGTGGRVFTLPTNVNLIWPNGAIPALNTTVNRVDALQFSTDDGVNYIGSILTSSAVGSSLTLNSLAGTTIYPGSSIAVAGSYTGLAPANLGLSSDAGAYSYLAAGTATITNGTFSFAQAAASTAGAHTLQVNASNNPGEVSNLLSYTVAAPAPPTNVTEVGSAGTGSVALTSQGTANGAAITSFTEQQATSASGPFTTVTSFAPGASPISGTTNASGTITGLTNGSAYYFQTIANTTAGNVTSAVAGPFTPTASASAAPTHYLASDSSHNSYVTTASTSPNITDGYLDVIVWANFTTYTSQNLASKWAFSGTNTGSNSSWIFQLNSAGDLFVANWASAFTSAASTITAVAAQAPSATTGEYYRVQENLGTASVTTASGPVGLIPSGSVVFSESPDGVNWVQVGTAVTGMGSGGISTQTSAGLTIGTLNSSNIATGQFYQLIERNSAGTILANPNYTTLTTGQTTFADTAATPLNYTIAASGEK